MTENLQNLPKQHTPQDCLQVVNNSAQYLLGEDHKLVKQVSDAFSAISAALPLRHTDKEAFKALEYWRGKLWQLKDKLNTAINSCGTNHDRHLVLAFCLQAVNDTLTEAYK